MSDAPAPAPAASLPTMPSRRGGILDIFYTIFDNPVLRRELLTALRSNKAFMLQFVFLGILSSVIYFAWPPETEVTARELQAQAFFRLFGQGQLVLISVMAPAFSAGAMTMEKEKRCIDLLLTSPIKPSTILMGKYMSSVLYLFLLIASTAPLACVAFWLPGVAPAQVWGLYILLLSVAASFGMIGLTCSTFFARTQSSLSISYAIVLPLALVLLVFSVAWESFFYWTSAIWPAGILIAATISMYQACLRRLRQPFDPVYKAAEEEDISKQTGLVLVRDRFPDNLLAPPKEDTPLPDRGNVIYQKEIRSEILGRGTLFIRLIIQISMFLSVVFLTFLFLKREYIFVYYLLVFTMLVAPAFSCTVFTNERERGTLDLLLTSLVRPHTIIWGKFLSCCRLSMILTGLVGLTLVFFLFSGGNSPNAASVGGVFVERVLWFMMYLAILVATIVLETLIGMFFSMISRTTMQSMILTYSAVLVLFGAPVAARMILSLKMAEGSPYLNNLHMACFTSPFEAAWSVAWKTTGDSTTGSMPPMVWPLYLGFAAVLSLILLGYIHGSFERWSTKSSRSE